MKFILEEIDLSNIDTVDRMTREQIRAYECYEEWCDEMSQEEKVDLLDRFRHVFGRQI